MLRVGSKCAQRVKSLNKVLTRFEGERLQVTGGQAALLGNMNFEI